MDRTMEGCEPSLRSKYHNMVNQVNIAVIQFPLNFTVNITPTLNKITTSDFSAYFLNFFSYGVVDNYFKRNRTFVVMQLCT
jgi:hypothetical protein